MQQDSSEDQTLPAAVSTEFALLEAVSPSMRAVEAVVRELAHSSVPVLLLGERGTGKRTIAERIHRVSDRSSDKFLQLLCSEVQSTTLGAGAFPPGATLYLEEVSDLKADAQNQLLDLLSRQEPNGSGLHVIGGTSRDLEAEIRTSNFREDLYYRLSGVCLRIPPLRQRREDIPHLMSAFLAKHSQTFQRPVPHLSDETQQLFLDYSWPGNLPELDAVARAIAAVGDESVAMGGLRSMLTRSSNGHGNGNGHGSKISLKDAARAASREAEKELILKVLNRTRWNRRRAAQELQISYKALLYKLKQIGYGEYGAT